MREFSNFLSSCLTTSLLLNLALPTSANGFAKLLKRQTSHGAPRVPVAVLSTTPTQSSSNYLQGLVYQIISSSVTVSSPPIPVAVVIAPVLAPTIPVAVAVAVAVADPNQIVLGSAATYSVFASTGISTVPGDLAAGQIVNGDIGVAPIAITAITGFGAVEDGSTGNSYVSGAIRGPPTTGTVALAVLTAFNAAYGTPITVPSNAGLATNYLDTVGTLNAGVYQWTGTIVIGVGTVLTLDGKCGDVFIFQSAGAVTTGANSQIILTGGLTAASVYWASATSFTSGVGSITAGIVLTGTTAVIAGVHTGAVYAQTSVALHMATINIPSIGSTTGTPSTICAAAT